MTTFFDVGIAVARKLGNLRTGTVDSGSSTTIVDSERTEIDDAFAGGTVWIIDTTDDLAPKGEWARVSGFVASTDTVTFDALTAVTEIGDFYGISTAKFPLDVIKTAINDKLIQYKAPRYDTTSLDVVAGQSEYELPAGITRYNLIGVYESTLDDADDNRWVGLDFEVITGVAGATHTLVIKSSTTVDNDLMLEWMDWHDPLLAPGDLVDEIVPFPRLVVEAAAHAVVIAGNTYKTGSDLDKEYWKFLQDQVTSAERRYPIRPMRIKGL